MSQRWRSAGVVAALLAAFLAPSATSVSAHVRKASGPYSVELGWAEEPAYSGLRNAVEVTVSDEAGSPVADPRGSLRVVVIFGSARRELALEPTGRRGSFAATIVPTRPGTYAFAVTGTLRGRRIDVRATCSDRTYDCVQSADAIEFPLPEPSGGELDRKLDRALARATRSDDDAEAARSLARVAVAIAALALLAAVVMAIRAARRD